MRLLSRGQAYATPDFTGIAAWLRPGTGIPNFIQQVRAGMLRLPLGFGFGFKRLLDYDEVARRMHHQYAAGPHWYLAAIGVDIGHQGRGIGSGLMSPLLAGGRRGEVVLARHPPREERAVVRATRLSGCRTHGARGHPIPVFGMLRLPRSRS